METPEQYIKHMVQSAPDDFGMNYDPNRKTKQIWRLEKLEQQMQNTTGSNSASFFLYRRAKFIEQSRVERMNEDEKERQRRLQSQQKYSQIKEEEEKRATKNADKRKKKKARKERFEKQQRGEVGAIPQKKLVRDESAVNIVNEAVSKAKEDSSDNETNNV